MLQSLNTLLWRVNVLARWVGLRGPWSAEFDKLRRRVSETDLNCFCVVVGCDEPMARPGTRTSPWRWIQHAWGCWGFHVRVPIQTKWPPKSVKWHEIINCSDEESCGFSLVGQVSTCLKWLSYLRSNKDKGGGVYLSLFKLMSRGR